MKYNHNAFKAINNTVHDAAINRPMSLSLLSKLRISNDNNNKIENFQLSQALMQTKEDSYFKISNNDDILILFPDTYLAIEMIISSMLSPNDFVTRNILYSSPDDLDLAPSIKQEIMKIIKDHMNLEYDFEDNFANIIKESLFTKGAYVEAIIPEASLDDLINNNHNLSLENINGYYNTNTYLGEYTREDENRFKRILTSHTVSKDIGDRFNIAYGNKNPNVDININLESVNGKISFKVNETRNNYSKKISLPIITDKETMLKSKSKEAKEISKRISKDRNMASLESFCSEEDTISLDSIFKPSLRYKNKSDVIIKIKTKSEASRKSIGKPLVLKLPVESVIPVHAVNEPSSHVGYFVAVDDYGNPLNVSEEMSNILSSGNDFINNTMDGREFITRGVNDLYNIDKYDPMFEENERIYIKLVEDMIKTKVRNGSFKDLVEVQDNMDIYRMMFYRTLKDRGTKLVYLPAEIVSYWAFNYRPNGTGESLLERVAPLFSIRGILLMVTILSYIKNSTTTTEVNITLDEKERLPEYRIEEIITQIMKNRDRQFPLGMMRIHELQDWAVRSGYKFNIDSPTLPELKIESQQNNPNFKIPDNELDDMFLEKILNTFGIVPEMVKQGMDPEFATTTTLRNVLNNNRIKEKQKVFNRLASEHVRRIISNDELLRSKIITCLGNNIEGILDLYIKYRDSDNNNLPEVKNKISEEEKIKVISYVFNKIQEGVYLRLPEPKSTEAPLLYNAITTECQQIDEIVSQVFETGAFDNDQSGEMRDYMDYLKGIVKLNLKLKTLTDNNAMPDITEIFNSNIKDQSTLLTNFLSTKEAFNKNMLKFLAKDKGQNDMVNTGIELINNGEEDNGGFGGGSSGGSSFDSSSSSDSGDSGDDLDAGSEDGDDLGGGFDDGDDGFDDLDI